jgi:5-methyltetrahydropteroyltriglutamate--homocysteine methyltransferase
VTGLSEREISHLGLESDRISRHGLAPGLRDMVDPVLMANAQAYSIETSNPRHEHEWQIWRDLKLPEERF